MVANSFSPQLLDGDKYPDTIPYFLDSHLLEHELIALDEVAASDIIDYNDLLITMSAR